MRRGGGLGPPAARAGKAKTERRTSPPAPRPSGAIWAEEETTARDRNASDIGDLVNVSMRAHTSLKRGTSGGEGLPTEACYLTIRVSMAPQ